jgi:hypothetical protein
MGAERAVSAFVLALGVAACASRPLHYGRSGGGSGADAVPTPDARDGNGGAGGYDAGAGDRDAGGDGAGAPNVACARSFHATVVQEPSGVAVDEHGHILVTGVFGGSFPFDGTVLDSAAGPLFIAELDSSCAVVWARALGSSTMQLFSVAAIAARPGGGAVLVGQGLGPIDLGTGVLSGGTFSGGWVLAIDDAGRSLWARSFASAGASLYLEGVAVSPTDGSIVATGSLAGTIDLGTGPLTQTSGEPQVLLLEFRQGGDLVWSEVFQDLPSSDGRNAAVAPDGAIAVGGYQNGTFAEDLANMELLVAGFDAGGARQWSTGGSQDGRRAGPGREARGVGFAADGTVIVTGTGPPPGVTDPIDPYNGGFFVTALARADGTPLWTRATRTSGVAPIALAVSGDTAALLGYGFAADFDFQSFTSADGGTHLWGFVVGFGRDGSTTFVQPIESTKPIPLPAGIAGDGRGGFAVAGYFSGTLTIGGSTLSNDSDRNDLYVARLSP